MPLDTWVGQQRNQHSCLQWAFHRKSLRKEEKKKQPTHKTRQKVSKGWNLLCRKAVFSPSHSSTSLLGDAKWRLILRVGRCHWERSSISNCWLITCSSSRQSAVAWVLLPFPNCVSTAAAAPENCRGSHCGALHCWHHQGLNSSPLWSKSWRSAGDSLTKTSKEIWILRTVCAFFFFLNQGTFHFYLLINYQPELLW